MAVRKVLTAGAVAAAGLATGVAVAAARSRPYVVDAAPPAPPTDLPPARCVVLPGRGEVLVRELAGPPGGPTVLLLHGWFVTADVNFFPAYAPLGRVARVIAFDHRGHGRGLRPSHPFRLADAAADAAAVIDALDAGPVIAVGYSMGGVVAQLLWRTRPDLVRGLVLCASSATYSHDWRYRAFWRGMGGFQLALRLLPRATRERVLEAQMEGKLPPILTRLVHPGTPQFVLEALPWIVGEVDRGSPEDVAEAGRELGRHEARDWIGEVDVPTVVLVTARDRLVPPALQRDLAARIPRAKAVELPLDHDGAVAGREHFVPALVSAVQDLSGPRPQWARAIS